MPELAFIDCQGLAGAWTLGTVQAGLSLTHRASLGKFGDEVIDANRHLMPGPWVQDDANGALDWTPVQAGLVIGTPPCSGFSLLNRARGKNERGAASEINNCMRELVRYAGRCTGLDGGKGTEIVSFESVQGAYSQGRSLMQALRDQLSDATGQRYSLSHVLMSGASVGNAQMRHRYYMVLHRIPFGLDPPERRRVATYRDAIGDLVGLKTDTWDLQAVPYDRDSTWWLREVDIVHGVHLHAPGDTAYYLVGDHVEPTGRKLDMMLEELWPYWPVGKGLEVAMRAYRAEHGDFPEIARKWWYYDTDEIKGITHPSRIHPDKPGYVLTGGCIGNWLHWEERRALTVRECARLMGYPDAWRWDMARHAEQAGNWIGKCCPVQSGRWISSWFKRALEGEPGPALEGIGEDEYCHNSTLLYKSWLRENSEVTSVTATPRPRKQSAQRRRYDRGVSDKRYEFARSEHRRLKVKPGETVLDLGAYVGAYTSVALDAGAAHVVAVEANPQAFQVLETGVGTSRNVTPVWGAVSAQAGGEITLHVPRRSGTTMSSIARQVGDPVQVPRVSLAELIERYKPDVVKMDIEGAEWELLDAGLELPGVRAVCIEFHRAGAGEDFTARIQDVFTTMAARNWVARSGVPSPSPTSKWPTYGFWEAA